MITYTYGCTYLFWTCEHIIGTCCTLGGLIEILRLVCRDLRNNLTVKTTPHSATYAYECLLILEGQTSKCFMYGTITQLMFISDTVTIQENSCSTN